MRLILIKQINLTTLEVFSFVVVVVINSVENKYLARSIYVIKKYLDVYY